jgi:hypothetical protein
MWETRPVGAGHDTLKVPLDLHRILLPGQPESLCEAPDVGVDDDALRMS